MRNDRHTLGPERSFVLSEAIQQIFRAPQGLGIMNDEGTGSLIQAHRCNCVRACICPESYDESDSILDQASGDFGHDDKKPYNVSQFFEPFCRSPLRRSPKRNLGRHRVRVDVRSHRSQRGGDTCGKAFFMSLDGTAKWQSNANAIWILTKIAQDLAMKG